MNMASLVSAAFLDHFYFSTYIASQSLSLLQPCRRRVISNGDGQFPRENIARTITYC